MEKYDVIFIGAGPGGYVGAIRAAQRGAKVAVVERDAVGGTCLNRGCIPTKALISSVEALINANKLEDFGIKHTGGFTPDLPAMHQRRRRIVASLVKGIEGLFKSNKITLIKGEARFVAKDKISVTASDGAKELAAAKIVIAVGARPAAIPGLSTDGKLALDSDAMLDSETIPESLAIIGAGAIGCEWATIYSALGSKVTIIEALPRILPLEDEEISSTMEREFKKKKIVVKTGVKITSLVAADGAVTIALDKGDNIVASRALVSIGRRAATDGLGLDALGVKTFANGRIEIDDRMETSVKGIYAIGDAAGNHPMLAHVASSQGIVAAENATGGDSKFDSSAIPSCVYTIPEAASVGLREHEAKAKNIVYKTGRFDLRALGRAQAKGEIAGMVKIVADSTGKIIGVHAIGHGASDFIHEGALAVREGISAHRLATMIHAHPTFAEALMEAAEDIEGKAIHVAPKKREAE